MKSKKKQKGGSSNNGIIVVAVVLLLAAVSIYAYNSFNSDKSISGLDAQSDLDTLSENLFPPGPEREIAEDFELFDADTNQHVDSSKKSGMYFI